MAQSMVLKLQASCSLLAVTARGAGRLHPLKDSKETKKVIEISLKYLTEEKFYSLSTSDEYFQTTPLPVLRTYYPL